jgi:small nuclear ribonucleoprotein
LPYSIFGKEIYKYNKYLNAQIVINMEKMNERPLDVLDKAKGKRVIVKLKNGEEISGILKALDLHLNIWLDDAEITKSENKIKIGSILIRGDTIIYAAPVV